MDDVAFAFVYDFGPAEEWWARRGEGAWLDGDRLDRSRLAAIVFADDAARRRLEAITHPRVREWMAARQAEATGRGDRRVVLDIPLLFENGLDRAMQAVILAYAPVAVQLERLIRRNGLSEQEARARLSAQMPIDDKVARATYVIDNSGSLDTTRAQTARVWNEISG
jgi:dephospho-CoA kinase